MAGDDSEGATGSKNHKACKLSGLCCVMPVPENAPEPPQYHPHLGAPSQWWDYLDEEGRLLGRILRFDKKDGGKEFRPLTLCNESGGLSWKWRSWPAPRPLYGLAKLAINQSSPVIVCEGEKAADAAALLLPGYVVVASSGGSKSAAKTDWTPLVGREVIVWPDADDAGILYSNEVAKCLLVLGITSVSVIDVPSDVSVGWDAADALREQWTASDIVALFAGAKPSNMSKAESNLPIFPGRYNSRQKDVRNGDTHKDGAERKKSKRDEIIISMLDNADLWHSPQKEAFATLSINGHREHWKLESQQFKRAFAWKVYQNNGNAITDQNLKNMLRILEVKAINENPCYRTELRVAWHEGVSWIDLCNEEWSAIRVDSNGWKVVETPPIKFVRTSIMQPLPTPEGGYQIEELRGFCNVSDADFMLIVAWLVYALWGNASGIPILAIGGQQGSGKSTLSKILRSLVDPSFVPIQSIPNDERDLIVCAENTHVLAFDNLSGVSGKISDSLCRLSTGGGYAVRKLHSDKDLNAFYGVKPILMNGIPHLTSNADLADRTLTVEALKIDAFRRQPEAHLLDIWKQALPRVLGALCDGLSSAIRNFEKVELKRRPRMADFAHFVEAASPGLGWEPGEFLNIYSQAQQFTAARAFEADPVAVAVYEFMNSAEQLKSGIWEGMAGGLLENLTQLVSDDMSRQKSWPRHPTTFGNRLSRALPALSEQGIEVHREVVSQGTRVTLRNVT